MWLVFFSLQGTNMHIVMNILVTYRLVFVVTNTGVGVVLGVGFILILL
jgi:hypothetical protein